jgi:uncharacterized heparinase superfamily protein
LIGFVGITVDHKLTLYYHTLRYLKVRQVLWRVWYRLVHPSIDASVRPSARVQQAQWHWAAARRPSLVDGGTFLLLNQQGDLSEVGWDGPQRDRLWRYNQHYFDDLNAEGARERTDWHVRLMANWIKANVPGQGAGWEPYPLSLRIVNWVKWQLSGNRLTGDCLQSLAVQARSLRSRIEWHILGNHLFSNAKALVFAGVFFDGSEAGEWLDRGLRIICREIPEQVLPDGGHFERSPMYHALFLEDVLDLINLAGAYPSAIPAVLEVQWRECAQRMLRWLQVMCHPDGEIAFFNDAAIGIAPTPAEIAAYAGRLGIVVEGGDAEQGAGIGVCRLADTGYLRLAAGDAILFLDVAPLGPDYLPGHGHADTLSFEMSLFGERIFVNGGTSEYGNGPVRIRERGTAAHNTVEVNGRNSSQVWSGFRVARRAYPIGLRVWDGGGAASISCGHDGYAYLPGHPRHFREWDLTSEKLLVSDRIEGDVDSAVARYHLHPDVAAREAGDSTWLLEVPGCSRSIRLYVVEGDAKVESGQYAPEFGRRRVAQCVVVRARSDRRIAVEIAWN